MANFDFVLQSGAKLHGLMIWLTSPASGSLTSCIGADPFQNPGSE